MSNNNSKRLAKNSLLLFFRMILVLIVGLYTSRVVLNTLGVSDYGVYNVVGGVVVMFSFLKQALHNATYRFFAYDLGQNNFDNLRKTFTVALNAHLILAIIVVIACETFGIWFLNNKLVIPADRLAAANIAFQFSMLCFFIDVVRTLYISVIVAHEKMSFFAYSSIIEVVLKLLIVYLLILFSFDKLILYAFLTLCVSIVMIIWQISYCNVKFSECKYMPKYWDSKKLKEMIGYSGWSLVVNGADVAVNQSIVFFVNIYFGVVVNAALGIANQVSSQLNNFLSSFSQAYNPQIIKSYAAQDYDYFKKLIYSASKFSAFLLLLAAIPLLLNIDFILEIWLKTVPEWTSTFALIIIMSSVIDAFSTPFVVGVHATGKLKIHQIIVASLLLCNLPLAYLLLECGLPAWSILVLKLCINFICSIVRVIYVERLYQIDAKYYFTAVLSRIICVPLLATPLPLLLFNNLSNPWITLLVKSILFFIIYIPTVLFIGCTRSERRYLFNYVQKKFQKIEKRMN